MQEKKLEETITRQFIQHDTNSESIVTAISREGEPRGYFRTTYERYVDEKGVARTQITSGTMCH